MDEDSSGTISIAEFRKAMSSSPEIAHEQVLLLTTYCLLTTFYLLTEVTSRYSQSSSTWISITRAR